MKSTSAISGKKERHGTEQALWKKREHYLTALSDGPVILFAIDPEGCLTFLEGRGLDNLGLDPGSLLGQSIFAMGFDLDPSFEPRFQRALTRDESEATVEYAGRIFRVRCSPLQDEGGQVTGLAGIAHDVTQHVKAEGELKRRNRELLTLQSAGAAITSSLDLQSVLDTVTKEMAGLLEMKACAIFQWSQESRTACLLAKHDPADWWAVKLPGDDYHPAHFPSTERALNQQCAQQVTVSQSDTEPAELAYMQQIGVGIVLRLPMVFQDRVMGLVEVMDDRKERVLTEEEVALAQLLANQAASAIENARLYDAIRRHVAEVTTLNRISQVITSILDLRETLAIIADHAHWLLNVAAASVILYDQESGDMWFGAASGEVSEFVRGRRLAKGKGIVDWVIQHGEPLVVPDASQDPRFFDKWDEESGFTTRSVLCVPLQTKGQTIGAIEAINKASGAFDQEDLNLLASMAASAAIAIENARLYQKAQQEIAERKRVEARLRKVNRALRTLGECHEVLVHAEEEPVLLQDVCRILVDIGQHQMAWIGFAEQEEKEVRLTAQAGFGEGYPDTEGTTWVERKGEPGLVGTAVWTRSLRSAQDLQSLRDLDPLSAGAVKQGYGSAIALPLVTRTQTLGILTIYAEDPHAFDAEEAEILKELANNLTSGILALRVRAERDRAEEEIRRLYQELQDHASNLEETVTERTRELQAERDRTQAILEAVGEAVIVTDLDGSIQYLNPAAVELTGYTAEEAMAQSPQLWQYDDKFTEVYPEAPDARGSPQTRRAEVVSRRRDGTLYDAAMTVAPLYDSREGGRLIGHVCAQRDISPIKEAERLKDRFVSDVSHELRTPLSVITLVSGNLDRLYDGLSDDRRRKMVRDIRDHAQVLNDLVGDVLEISRIESGRVSMERAIIDLMQLVQEEAEKQSPLAEKKSQVLRVTGTRRLAIHGNADQLRQVIRNLLNNAIKFTPSSGQITCECTVQTAAKAQKAEWPGSDSLPSGQWAAVRVVDTGVGISPEDLPRVFERFFRVERQGSIPGTGLGLAISKELIELHGGQIAIASTQGQGSIFAIYVPFLEES